MLWYGKNVRLVVSLAANVKRNAPQGPLQWKKILPESIMKNVSTAGSVPRYVQWAVSWMRIGPAVTAFRSHNVGVGRKIRRDLLLILGLLLAAGAALGLTLLFRSPGDWVVVEVDGEVFGRYPLNETASIRIETGTGGYNVLEIADGYASVTEASCPDKLCVHQHKISHSDETIVCLPNKVVVSVVPNGE